MAAISGGAGFCTQNGFHAYENYPRTDLTALKSETAECQRAAQPAADL
jgi:hypothetical protein